jgi:hypothetical protein
MFYSHESELYSYIQLLELADGTEGFQQYSLIASMASLRYGESSRNSAKYTTVRLSLTPRYHRLVATARNTTRRVPRKAILEVDVTKACDTITAPGAPIALRLQGSLLYGVSRVYSQQCGYVLTDAEKVQDHMRRFVQVFDSNLLPTAGKAK